MQSVEEENRAWEVLHQARAVWRYPGNGPHVQLSHGMCSNLFVNCERVLVNRRWRTELALMLAARLMRQIGASINSIETVLSPGNQALLLATDLAATLNAQAQNVFVRREAEAWIYTGPRLEGVVLPVDDTITSGKSFLGMCQAFQSVHRSRPPRVLNVVGCIFRRRCILDTACRDLQIVSLVEEPDECWTVPQSECKLCRAGSARVKPRQQWEKLISLMNSKKK